MRAYNHFLKTLNRVEETLNIEAGLMAGMENKKKGQAIIEAMVNKEQRQKVFQRGEKLKLKPGEQKCESLQRYRSTERRKQ